ncbi:hypothetical protein SAMN06265365_15013 [Tistlia consotensis]|uniref:Uncharacterized protein n=1 Tax=Tistlia consotensis USBA 355 TaxID=560819 RepID=A0A1Y6CRW3_9PROT|nr:hypothetical protein SAMN05428998_15020 [Tistlia consotensis USBA 355]SNS33577.1 hypothetical protein SAMN06265365_15013 [Tistlia consotensis]
MIKKDEAERVIRHLCHEWARESGIPREPVDQPSFFDFKSWLSMKGYSHYLNFRSVMGANYDAERWFDEEFKQTWRN